MQYEQWVIPCTYVGKDTPSGPTPDEAGLEKGTAYLVINTVEGCGINGEIWYNVINKKGQTWSLSNRHFRTVQIGVAAPGSIEHWYIDVSLLIIYDEVYDNIECLGS